jgi:hypothetical protein
MRACKPLTLAIGLCVTAFPASYGAKEKTPTQFYQEYLAAREKATSIRDLARFMTKEVQESLRMTPPGLDREALEALKEAAPRRIRVVQETSTGKEAFLDLEGVTGPRDSPQTGKVNLSKDSSGWHIGSENWNQPPKGAQ